MTGAQLPSGATIAGRRRRSGRRGGCRMEYQGKAIHAVAQAGRLRPIVEDVTEMAAAAAAVNFGPQYPESPVFGLADLELLRGVGRRSAQPPEGRKAKQTSDRRQQNTAVDHDGLRSKRIRCRSPLDTGPRRQKLHRLGGNFLTLLGDALGCCTAIAPLIQAPNTFPMGPRSAEQRNRTTRSLSSGAHSRDPLASPGERCTRPEHSNAPTSPHPRQGLSGRAAGDARDAGGPAASGAVAVWSRPGDWPRADAPRESVRGPVLSPDNGPTRRRRRSCPAPTSRQDVRLPGRSGPPPTPVRTAKTAASARRPTECCARSTARPSP